MLSLRQTPKTLMIMAMNENIFTYEGHTNNVPSVLKIQSRTTKANQSTMFITGDK
jgi:hypothetical protein